MPTVTTAVLRHQQDSGLNCGRACAQMLIAHVAQAAAARGSAVTDQSILQTREPFPQDDIKNPSWYTHPDELQILLAQAPELQGFGTSWNVEVRETFKSLSAVMLEALVNGMPSAITTGPTDHWMVLVGAGVSDDNGLQFLQFLDPLPPIGQATAHTIGDNCGLGFNGETYVPQEVTSGQFGSFGFRVESVPPPGNLTNYSDKFVAVVGSTVSVAPPVAAEVADGGTEAENGGTEAENGRTEGNNGGARGRDRNAPRRRRGGEPQNVKRWIERSEPTIMRGNLVDALAALAARWRLPPLRDLVDSSPTDAVRRVQNIDRITDHYNLFTLRSQNHRYGLIGGAAPDGTLLHFQFTTNSRLLDSIAAAPPGEPLWWSHRRTRTLSSPYYPFRRLNPLVVTQPRFSRLFDDFEVSPETPGANR
jgi:hypothetical protein